MEMQVMGGHCSTGDRAPRSGQVLMRPNNGPDQELEFHQLNFQVYNIQVN